MAVMILKTYNIFKKEDNKEVGKQRIQSNNNSHESLMAENVITNRPSGLQMSNENCSSISLMSCLMNPTLFSSKTLLFIVNNIYLPQGGRNCWIMLSLMPMVCH
jgi:hypothetical protein